MNEQSMVQQQNGPVYLTNGIQEQQQYTEYNGAQNYSNGTDQNYLPSMPSDGSMPYRTNPIGEPVTKRYSLYFSVREVAYLNDTQNIC